jgi:hypothetical protein
MFGIMLLDTAYALFFNHPPRVQLQEVRLTLPSDDAAWEASTMEDCANALGLNGQGPSAKNITGTRNAKQPEFLEAMGYLLQPQSDFKPGTTNAYSKFILIHALHTHIWTTQEILPNATDIGIGQATGGMDSSPVEWKSDGGQPIADAAHAVRTCQYALEKWKKAWDTDFRCQYPNPSARVGFCRDGLPFYWLAKLYLARNRTTYWRHGIDDDRTVAKVKNMLMHVRGFIAEDTGRLDLQGAVSAIDDGYAVDELTYDMKLLFRPIPSLDDGGGESGSPE